jgi:hypothetical protein
MDVVHPTVLRGRYFQWMEEPGTRVGISMKRQLILIFVI